MVIFWWGDYVSSILNAENSFTKLRTKLHTIDRGKYYRCLDTIDTMSICLVKKAEECLALETSFTWPFFFPSKAFNLLGCTESSDTRFFLGYPWWEIVAVIKRPFSCPFCDGSASLWQCSATQAWLLQECDKHHHCVLLSSIQLFLLFILSYPSWAHSNLHYSYFLLLSVFLLPEN